MYLVRLTTKDIKKILSEYFKCDTETVELSPYIHDREEGVNAWVFTSRKEYAGHFDACKVSKEEMRWLL